MPYSIYESISNNQPYMVNAFAAFIQSSAYHWHDEYELIGILKGSIIVKTGSESTILEKGDILLINSKVFHAIQSIEGEENLCMVVQIKSELFMSDQNDDCDIRFYLNSTREEAPACGYAHFYQKMAGIIYETMSEEKQAVFRIRAYACSLIADLFDYVVYDIYYPGISQKVDQELTIAIIGLFEKNLENEKLLEMACHEFGLSRKTLDRNIKKITGVTAKEIVANLRLEKAKNLLKNTNHNMNYILDACGFGSEKTFYRLFRQETGLTPRAFREKGAITNENGWLKNYLDFEEEEVREILKEIMQKD